MRRDLCGVRRSQRADACAWRCATTRAALATLAVAGLCAVRRLALVTVVLSLDPGASSRRFALTVCVVAVAGDHDAVAEIAERVDALVQHRRAGAAGDLLSRNLAGAESVDPSGDRSAGAGARRQLARRVRPQEHGRGVMAMVVFLGVYVIRSGAWISGAAIVALASLFLLYSAGKSSLTLLPGSAVADVGDVGHPLVLASRRHACCRRCCCSICERRHGDV